MLSKDQKRVLVRVTQTLKEHNIPFQITGGLAAIAYGSRRDLFDIDIDVSKKDIEKIRKLFREHITEDLHHLQNGRFDIYVMSLEIDDVIVDISQLEENYVIDKKGNKIGGDYNLRNTKLIKVDGIEIPVEDKTELVNYKKILGRDTDLIDIQQMTENPK
jgi:hypothetical protein